MPQSEIANQSLDTNQEITKILQKGTVYKYKGNQE